MIKYYILFQLFISFITKCNSKETNGSGNKITLQTFVYWPNATVPFFIDPNNFDHEQALTIMKSLSRFRLKTCINFMPVMTAPKDEQHVMTFVNPDGIKRCRIQTRGHSNFKPHVIQLGYDCLKSSDIDMIIMRALGFPFEHTRMSRDLYIDVKVENIEPGYIELFSKDEILPPGLREIPYDSNSVMHFGERDYSKNGHRTIVPKVTNIQIHKNGLSEKDVKKIEIVYGPECQKRDRAEKKALCHVYPYVGRRKREIVEPLANMSLRVNPNITPPPEILAAATKEMAEEKPQSFAKVIDETDDSDDVTESLNTLKIVKETDKVLELIYQISSQALNNAREIYCNITRNTSSNFEVNKDVTNQESRNQISADVFGIQKVIVDFAKAVVDDADKNVTEFCQHSETIEAYQRQCRPDDDPRCPRPFRSKSGAEKAGKLSTENKKETNEETTTTPLQLNRRKREASNNVTTPKSTKAVKEVTTTKTTTKPTNTTVTTPTSLKANNAATNASTTKSSKAVKENTAIITTTKFKKIVFTISKSPENTNLKDNLKERINTMRKQRLKEIQRVNMTAMSKLAAVTGTESNENKTIFSSLQIKARKTKEEKEFAAAKFKLVTSKTDSSKRRFVEIKKNRLKEIEKGKVRAAVTEEKAEPFRRVSMEQTYAAESSQSSEEDDAEDKQSSDTSSDAKQRNNEELRITSESSEVSVEITTPIAKQKRKKAIQTVAKETESDISQEPIPIKKNERTHRSSAVPKTVALSKLNVEFYADRRWPHGDLIYVIKELPDYDLEDLRDRLAEVNSILSQKTCVKLREVSMDESEGFEDYIILDNSPDFVTGRVGGKQCFGSIELFEGGQHRQHAAMMVMAMLGFYFEVSRHDRDKHIRVHNRHIRPDKLHHFEKNGDEATLDLPYDYKSATHPAIRFWRKSGKTGMATVATYKKLDRNSSIMRMLGQNTNVLSELDIIKINSVYGVKCFLNQASRSGRSVKKNRHAKADDAINVV